MADDSSARTAWTDHNVHDPGVTLVELLVYTLGAVGLVAMSAALITRRRRFRDPALA
jgi:hypothetical protein